MFWTRATVFKQTTRLRTAVVVAGLAALLLVWLASTTRPWLGVENKVFDWFTSASAARRVDVPIVILAIDEPTFSQLQIQWPFPRRLHAQVLDRLRADGALAVGFDMVFAEPSQAEDDAAFATALQAGLPVVLGASREVTESANASQYDDVLPLNMFLGATSVAGQLEVTPDDDFVVRRHTRRDDTFSARLVALAGWPKRSAAVDAGPYLLEYVGPRATFDTRSYYQVLEPGLLPPGFFKGKVVLIGRSVRTAVELAGSQSDMFNSPFAVSDGADRLIPGVEVQANLVSNQWTGGGIQSVDSAVVLALPFAMLATLGLIGMRANPSGTAALAGALVVGVWALSYILFAGYKMWLPPLFPMASLLAVYGSAVLLGYATSRRRALQVRMMFSQYVPEAVVARLVERPDLLKLGGEARELTLMFTDLANFTAMSEQLTAEATVEVLTDYFNAMTTIIHRHGGTVDKFIGDAVMAFWGAPLDDPRHAENAVRAAIEMQSAMQALVQQLTQRGLPPIAMRVGLHTGRAVVGNIGSQSRFSYSVIGDAVNLASRLEGANKAFGTGILVSDTTARALPADITLRLLDKVVVKGKSASIAVYTPCADTTLVALSLEAVESFYRQQWDASESAFKRLLLLRAQDPASLRFLGRIADHKALPQATLAPEPLSLDKL
ncbi:MAG: adenylate/guanylate cyclase domain-containing protein [Pseudomonadota bacterium]